MNQLLETPLFGLLLSILGFTIGHFVYQKTKFPLFMPLIVGVVFVITVLLVFDIPLATYEQGGDIISFFLLPATASLGLTIYRVWPVLKQNWLPALVGSIVGVLTSTGTTLLFCKMFNVSELVTQSLFAKQVTTLIAIELAVHRGGDAVLVTFAVCIVGIFGSIAGPFLIKIFKIKDPIAQGVALGTISHGLGTARALTLGEVQGAMSAVAMSICAFITVLVSMIY